MVLARYSTKYFTDLNINVLVRSHFSTHIKKGHSMEMRLVETEETDTKKINNNNNNL
jgi:hypothetical protein